MTSAAMTMSAAFEETILELIATLPQRKIAMPNGLLELAERMRVLPVVWDMGGVAAITPEGLVVSWPWDEEESVSESTSLIDRHCAFFRGAARYSELRRFLPQRGENSRTCTGCNGTGKVLGLPSDLIDKVSCLCGGAGWLPE